MSARGLERDTPIPDQGDDAVCELGRRWVEAFNRRDADALIGLADDEIEFHPTLLAGARRTYHGHAGLRLWLEDVAATSFEHRAEATVVRCSSSGELVISGNIVVGDEAVSPFSMRFRAKDGKFVEAWAYLSDEALLSSLGRLDAD
ncbi:MAG: nuclear transport factor 2 family protein [Solirubrobacteraceae bacterium]